METGKDYLTYKGKKVMTLKAMRHRFNNAYPDKLPPQKPDAPQVSLLNLVALAVIVVAVNVLSGAHTIPMIQEFYDLDPVVLTVIGFSGFLAIEGAMVLLMAQEQRSKLAWTVIVLAFLAALGSNTYKTFEVFNVSDGDVFLIAIATLFGLFAPSANLVAGEVLHNMQLTYKKTKREAQDRYNATVSRYHNEVQTYYRKYLTRIGIKEVEDQELILAGYVEQLTQDAKEEKQIEKKKEIQKQVKEKSENSTTIKKLLQKWSDESIDPNSYTLKELAQKYNVSIPTASKARKKFSEIFYVDIK